MGGDTEKPLVAVDGRPMVDRVLAGLHESRVDEVLGVVSPQAPATRAHLADRVAVIETDGAGYVSDLQSALAAVDPPVVTVPADLPLLAGDVVDDLLTAATGSTTALVPAALKRHLGLSVDADRPWVPAGVNVVRPGDPDTAWRTWDARLAVNVNRRADIAVAAALAHDGS